MRGLSLLLLPFVSDFAGLRPRGLLQSRLHRHSTPTNALVADKLGRMHIGAVFAPTSSRIRSAVVMAAYLGGIAYGALGNHTAAFLAAGILAILAALMASRINREPLPPVPDGQRP